MHVKVRGQPARSGSPCLLSKSPRSYSGHCAWQQVPVPTDPYHWPQWSYFENNTGNPNIKETKCLADEIALGGWLIRIIGEILSRKKACRQNYLKKKSLELYRDELNFHSF